MNSARAILTPPPIATEAFTDAAAAVARLDEIYQRNTQFLRDRFEAYVNGEPLSARVRANYPFVRLTTSTHVRLDSRLAYGFVARPGVYETTVTRPDLFQAYLTHQIRRLIENHDVPVEIGESKEAIPMPWSNDCSVGGFPWGVSAIGSKAAPIRCALRRSRLKMDGLRSSSRTAGRSALANVSNPARIRSD